MPPTTLTHGETLTLPPIYRPILIGGSLSHYAKRRRYPLTSSRALHCQSSSHALPRQKIGTANHAHIVDIMHTPRKTPPPNPQKRVKIKLPAFGNTLLFSNTRNTRKLDTASRHSVHRSTHGSFLARTLNAPPNRFRLGYAAPRCLTATASSAGHSQHGCEWCCLECRTDLARLTA